MLCYRCATDRDEWHGEVGSGSLISFMSLTPASSAGPLRRMTAKYRTPSQKSTSWVSKIQLICWFNGTFFCISEFMSERRGIVNCLRESAWRFWGGLAGWSRLLWKWPPAKPRFTQQARFGTHCLPYELSVVAHFYTDSSPKQSSSILVHSLYAQC